MIVTLNILFDYIYYMPYTYCNINTANCISTYYRSASKLKIMSPIIYNKSNVLTECFLTSLNTCSIDMHISAIW